MNLNMPKSLGGSMSSFKVKKSDSHGCGWLSCSNLEHLSSSGTNQIKLCLVPIGSITYNGNVLDISGGTVPPDICAQVRPVQYHLSLASYTSNAYTPSAPL